MNNIITIRSKRVSFTRYPGETDLAVSQSITKMFEHRGYECRVVRLERDHAVVNYWQVNQLEELENEATDN